MHNVKQGAPEAHWDKVVQSLGGHGLQSRSWATFLTVQGYEPWYAYGTNWCWLGFVRSGKGAKYLYVPYGPTINHKGTLEQAIISLKDAAEFLKVDFVRIEPIGNVTEAELQSLGCKRAPETQPQRTIVIDLRHNIEELRRGVSQSNRNLINTAEKRGVTFQMLNSPNDINDFIAMLRATEVQHTIHLYNDDYFHKLAQALLPNGQAKLAYASFNGRRVASALIFDFSSTRYYLYAGAHYELNRQAKAAVPLLWYLIADAKQSGCSWFDFCGIAPTDDPRDKKASLTRFKQSFGGYIISRAGTWELPIKRAKYRFYRFARYAAAHLPL